MNELKEFRNRMGYSQIKMAALLEVSINAYINWERNVMMPNEENQKKIDELIKNGGK